MSSFAGAAEEFLPAGFVLQRESEDALHAAFLANGKMPLSAAQAIAVCGTPPVYPTTLRRLPPDAEV